MNLIKQTFTWKPAEDFAFQGAMYPRPLLAGASARRGAAPAHAGSPVRIWHDNMSYEPSALVGSKQG